MKINQASEVSNTCDRREFGLTSLACLLASSLCTDQAFAFPIEKNECFRLKYLLASPMYGYATIAEILPEVAKTGAAALDIWPKVHGNQREQVDEMGVDAFADLLHQNEVKLGAITCYASGPFNLQSELDLLSQLPSLDPILITGAKGPKDLVGDSLKKAVATFVNQMAPHVASAEKANCKIAIENHAGNLLSSPDSIKWFAEECAKAKLSDTLGVALAPHHLPQDEVLIADLTRSLGPAVKFFYAQQHGMGSREKLPKEQELLQMPGRGPLDFKPILNALQSIKFTGYTEIFMHPVLRGVPILENKDAITAEINRARNYLETCLG